MTHLSNASTPTLQRELQRRGVRFSKHTATQRRIRRFLEGVACFLGGAAAALLFFH